jgi:chemotaxis-related protein WspD
MNVQYGERRSEVPTGVDDCWNRIGVRGDQSCPELIRHLHCRNCPAYSAGARALLDKPVATEYSRLWAEHYAQAPQPMESESSSVIIFRVGLERFALPTRLCIEVASPRPIHSLPHRRGGAVLGLTNVHGELVACMSLAIMLNLTTTSGPQAVTGGQLLVTGWPDGPVAFSVDEVTDVRRFPAREFKRPPATVAHAQAKYTKAILSSGEHTVGVLDEDLLEYTIKRSLA